jgi:CDP-glucose 4,6-dehydratase
VRRSSDPTSWHGRRVLVTGIGGLVGSALAKRLVEEGADVVGVVRDSPGKRMLELRGIAHQVAVVSGSLADPGLAQRAVNEYEVDTVFHLAAQALVGVANRSPISTFESNILATWQVLEAARLGMTVERVVVASSDKAYGNQKVLPYTESTPLGGLYPYDASKACADILARSYAATYGVPIAVARCANIYGPGDLNWSRLIPGTIRSALSGEDPIIRSDGTPERDYIYLDDAVDAYLKLADAIPGATGLAFNFGTGTSISALEVVELILRVVDTEALEPRVLAEASGEIDRQCLDSTLAHKNLGWQPRTTLSEGLQQTVEWYRDHLAGWPASRRRMSLV